MGSVFLYHHRHHKQERRSTLSLDQESGPTTRIKPEIMALQCARRRSEFVSPKEKMKVTREISMYISEFTVSELNKLYFQKIMEEHYQ